MKSTELQKTLETLHTELNGAASVDDTTRAMLKTLAADIQRLSEQQREGTTDAVEPLTAQLQDMVLKFETDHPQLTRALNQVSAALANLGI